MGSNDAFTNPERAFVRAMVAYGLTPPDAIQADGKFYRFSANGKRSDDAGWCVLHQTPDGAFGFFGNWRENGYESWSSIDASQRTPEQQKQHAAAYKAMQNARHRAKKVENDAAAPVAQAIWDLAVPVGDTSGHGYLTAKGTESHGARVIDAATALSLCDRLSPVLGGPLLVIPMRNAAGELRSLQFITTDGTKRPLTGGEKKGCHYLMGDPTAGTTIVCEGFATGASIHEATGQTVAVAFDAGNLEAVSKSLRNLYPRAGLVIAADDDWRTDGNPGRKYATAAARAVGGTVVVPLFPKGRPDKETDFNDLHQLVGLDAVRACFAGAIEFIAFSDAVQVSTSIQTVSNAQQEVSADTDHASATEVDHLKIEAAAVAEKVVKASHDLVTEPQEGAGLEPATSVTSEAASSTAGPFPGMDQRPRYVVLDDWAESPAGKHRPGVYYCGIKAEKGDRPAEPFEQWICSPLHVDAVTFDEQSNNFGRLLRFKPTVGKCRVWAMPMELLAGDGSPLRAELLAMGVELDPFKAQKLLPHYLQSEHPKRQVRCALQVGWCGDSFVLPDVVIGTKAESVTFQSGDRGHDEHTQGGTLAGWQEGIAAKAVGNSLLMLAVSASFAGPLLKRCNAEGGGIHFVGDSSTGKTTLIEAACATWGGAGFKRSWRTTSNGMEGAAALFNDCLLALDEISECDPREVGAIVYALGNGRGKQRAGRSGSARAVARWLCIVLSSGERTIATSMGEGGHSVKAGQAVRLLDIPVAQAYGAWDTLHGAATPSAFSDAIKRTAAHHHGFVGRAFLEKLTRDTTDFCAMLDTVKALPLFDTDGTDGQHKRAAARLALVALAGELATDYGLTGWNPGEATKAAARAFRLWQSMRGKGNDERRQIAEKVLGFIERHGDSRFSSVDHSGDTHTVRDRAGWWRNGNDGREYLFTADGMREALKGFDFNRALDVLLELGATHAPGGDGKRTRLVRVGTGRPVRLYPIYPEKLGE